MGGDWQQWHVPSGDACAHGLAKGHEGVRVGIEFGTTDHDKVGSVAYPAPSTLTTCADMV